MAANHSLEPFGFTQGKRPEIQPDLPSVAVRSETRAGTFGRKERGIFVSHRARDLRQLKAVRWRYVNGLNNEQHMMLDPIRR